MTLEKKNRICRIVCSALAFAFFVAFALWVIISEVAQTSKDNFNVIRLAVNYSIFLIPYIALLLFSCIENTFVHMNKRVYVILIVAITCVVNFLAVVVMDGLAFSGFHRFFTVALDLYNSGDTILLVAQIIMFFILPWANDVALKLYSGAMVLLSVIAIGYNLFLFWNTGVFFEISTMTLISYLLFYTSLFYFSDLLTKESRLNIFDFLSIIFDEDDESDCFDDYDELEEEISFPNFAKFIDEDTLRINSEFTRVVAYSFLSKYGEHLHHAFRFLKRLALVFYIDDTAGEYNDEFIASQFELIYDAAKMLHDKDPDFMGETLINAIADLLDQRDSISFKFEAVILAQKMYNLEDRDLIDAKEKLFSIIGGK